MLFGPVRPDVLTPSQKCWQALLAGFLTLLTVLQGMQGGLANLNVEVENDKTS